MNDQTNEHIPSLRLADHIDRPVPMVLHTRVIANTSGGPDKTIIRSLPHADNNRLRMAAAYIYPAGDKAIEVIRDHADSTGAILHEIPELGPIDLRTLKHLITLCREHRVTVWHSHDYKTDILGLVARRYWPMKLVSTAHGFTCENLKTRIYAQLDYLALRRFDHVLAVSPQLMRQMKSHGVAPEKLSYVPNAIDPTEYNRRQSRAAARANLEIEPDRFTIGVVGRLSKEKGVDRAVRTCARLLRNYPNLEMHLVGDGPQRDTLATHVSDLGLDPHVKFHGWQEDTQPYYEAMDMLLLPSHTEGLPNAVLEAMALGVPVAATEVGGVRDLLHWGSCGVILDKDDELTWPNLIAPLIVSADRRDELARRARRRVEKHYSFKTRMGRVMSIYEQLLKVKSIAPGTTLKAA